MASRNIYIQWAPVGITRLLRLRHLLIIETYQGLSFPFIYTRLVSKYSKGDWSFKVFFNQCVDFDLHGKRINQKHEMKRRGLTNVIQPDQGSKFS